MSGAGQEYIYSKIIDELQTIDHSKIGLVIAAWSTAPRRDYQIYSCPAPDILKFISSMSNFLASIVGHLGQLTSNSG